MFLSFLLPLFPSQPLLSFQPLFYFCQIPMPFSLLIILFVTFFYYSNQELLIFLNISIFAYMLCIFHAAFFINLLARCCMSSTNLSAFFIRSSSFFPSMSLILPCS